MNANMVDQLAPWILGGAILTALILCRMLLVSGKKKIRLAREVHWLADKLGLQPEKYVQEVIGRFEQLPRNRIRLAVGLISAMLFAAYVLIEFQDNPLLLAGGLLLGLAAALAFLCGERLSSRKYFSAFVVLVVVIVLLEVGGYLVAYTLTFQGWYDAPIQLPMLQA
jgi:hypothetical protein